MKQELMDAIQETPVIAAVKDDAGLCNALTIENIRVVFVLYGDICNICLLYTSAQTLLERYGTARAGVWKACLVSGVLFGAAHLSNLLGSEAFGVLMQCVFAASLGVMLAAIYFRTGNLWVTVFLHLSLIHISPPCRGSNR